MKHVGGHVGHGASDGDPLAGPRRGLDGGSEAALGRAEEHTGLDPSHAPQGRPCAVVDSRPRSDDERGLDGRGVPGQQRLLEPGDDQVTKLLGTDVDHVDLGVGQEAHHPGGPRRRIDNAKRVAGGERCELADESVVGGLGRESGDDVVLRRPDTATQPGDEVHHGPVLDDDTTLRPRRPRPVEHRGHRPWARRRGRARRPLRGSGRARRPFRGNGL